MSDNKTALGSHAESIFLAVLLYLLGEKSLVLAKLALHGFDRMFKGRAPSPDFVYEISLVGLMIGTALVILVSKLRQKQIKKDNLAILIGMITATFAALFNIVEVIVDEPGKYGPVPGKALFFFVLWTVLVVLPVFAQVLQHGEKGELDLTQLVRTVAALLFATLIGLAMRPAISAILLYGLEVKNTHSLNSAFDWMRFNSDSLIMLGAVWWVAAFGAFSREAGQKWRALYVVAAPLAGFFYAYVVSYPNGDPDYNVSAARLGVGFAALSLAAILPGVWFAKGVQALDVDAVRAGAIWTFSWCATAMLLGLSFTLPLSWFEMIAISVLQGAAGACIPVAVFASAWCLRRYGGQTLGEDAK